jgi:hypothetical protein
VSTDRELERFRWKLDAGAEFAIMQPVFDAQPLLQFMERARGLRRVPIIAGIRPLVSLRMAEFMKNEVPGVYVHSVIERMSKCDTKESALEEGTAIARELLEALKGAINGVQLYAPRQNRVCDDDPGAVGSLSAIAARLHCISFRTLRRTDAGLENAQFRHDPSLAESEANRSPSSPILS